MHLLGRGATAAVAVGIAVTLLGGGVPGVPAARAAAPVDVRGHWSGVAVVDIGTFPNTLNITTEDFTTGVVSGDANAGSYTFDGVVTGFHIHFTSSQKGGSYTATSELDVTPDGNTMDGTFSDTNGRSGTEHFTRDSAAPTSAASSPGPSPTAAPAPTPSATQPPGPTGACAPNPVSPTWPAETAPAANGSIVRVVSGAVRFPSMATIDTGDPRGRVFVAGRGPGITVIDGRPQDASRIDVEVNVAVATDGRVNALAADTSSGRVYVADSMVAAGTGCRLLVLVGRANTLAAGQSIPLPAPATAIAVDPSTGRILVALPDAGQLLVLDRNLTTLAVLPLDRADVSLAIDGDKGLAFAATSTATPGAGPAHLTVIDIGADTTPATLATRALDGMTALAVDPGTHELLTVDAQHGELAAWRVAADGALTQTDSVSLAAGAAPPVPTGPPASIALTGRTVLVAWAGGVQFFGIEPDGSLRAGDFLAGMGRIAGTAADPASGRVFLTMPGADTVAVLDTGSGGAPSLAYALPSPLQISLAPQDVARSIGIMSLIMLLIGAPTPIFNSTLSANRKLIERWGRRKLPRGLRRRAGSGGAAAFGKRVAALSTTWRGLIAYLLLVGVLYACLDARFPFDGAPRTLFTTLFAIAFGTAVSQIPGELYVRRRYKEGGSVRVVLWTLGLAVGCVLITRITGVQPGYVYGIIGGFTFKAALTKDDNGRMAWRGMVILLAAGFAAWILRIPFQPATGIVGGEVGSIANQLLAGIFVGSVESAAIGLMPLRFLSGATLFQWSRRRWALLWGLGLVLFAHVILYPVSSLEPHPSAGGLWTVLASVAIYGGGAMGFWWFWRNRAERHAARARRVAAA